MTNPANRYDERSALLSHDIDADLGLDYVRHEAFVLRVCLGCGTVTVAPNEITRRVMREVIDWDNAPCDSLPNCATADSVLY